MRLRRIAVSLLLIATTLGFPADAQAGGITIAELLPDPGSEREFIELYNAGEPIDLAGWQIRDAAGTTFTFPQWQLETGARVVVWGGGDATSHGPAWSRASVWNNGGDTVELLRPDGSRADTIAYGSATPLEGNTTLPVPATGQALVRDGATWRTADPTPGVAPGALQGEVSFTVQNSAPVIANVQPRWAAPGSTFELTFQATDPNGDADIVAWSVQADQAVIASGSGPNGTAALVAPGGPEWALEITVQDAAGANTTIAHTMIVRDSPLRLGSDGFGFPPLVAGSENVTSLAGFQLTNDADTPISPRIDVSDFRGPAVVTVQDNLEIVWTVNGVAQTVPYSGPLTQLPELAGGQTADIALRLKQIPMPLPAGDYGTSFAVIA